MMDGHVVWLYAAESKSCAEDCKTEKTTNEKKGENDYGERNEHNTPTQIINVFKKSDQTKKNQCNLLRRVDD